MDFLLSRYRNLTVLLIVIVAQLVLIAYQVKTNKEVPLLRVWAVTAVTPVEQGLEFIRRNTIGRVEDYFVLLGVRSENERLHKEVGELKLQNNYLQNELAMADRARALTVFQKHTPSKTLAAEIIGNGTGANSKVVFIDRGSASGVEAGMAVITPDGIVGKVLDAYPTASLVMQITDPTFAAGVVSQKNHVRGTLKGQGDKPCIVDYVQNEQKVEAGEWFYTSGDDRIFPKGFPVGKVDVVRTGKVFKEIYVTPSAFQGGIEEVLVVLEGVHQAIPETLVASPGYKLLAPPPDASGQKAQSGDSSTGVLTTDADRLKEEYKAVGQAQNHIYGEGTVGSKPPDFTKLGIAPPPPKPGVAGTAGASAKPANGVQPQAAGAPVKAQVNGALPANLAPPKPPANGLVGGSGTTKPATTGVAGTAGASAKPATGPQSPVAGAPVKAQVNGASPANPTAPKPAANGLAGGTGTTKPSTPAKPPAPRASETETVQPAAAPSTPDADESAEPKPPAKPKVQPAASKPTEPPPAP